LKNYKSFAEKIRFHEKCLKKKMWMINPIQEKDVIDNIEELERLLKAADCPDCDGSGSIPHQFMDGEWDQQQCQWCDERNKMIYNFEDNGENDDS
jgi:hypothetical protein